MSKAIEKVEASDMPAELLDQLKMAQQELMENEESFGGNSIKFISTKGNKLSLDGVDFPGNALACIIVDSIGVNALYAERYDIDAKCVPKCFAFGRNKFHFSPKEDDVTEKQADTCEDCSMQEWGSAAIFPHRQNPKAKACQSKRRLAIVCCGEVAKNGDVTLFDGNDLKESIRGEILFLDVSVTSIKNYKNYVVKVGTKYKGALPLFCVPTKISVIPDEKTQRVILFEEIKTNVVGGEEIEASPIRNAAVVKELLERHNEAKDLIVTPYPKKTAEDAEDTSDAKYAVKKR